MLEVDPLSARILTGLAIFAGAAVGSFLNVVIARLPVEGESIVRPRSRCPRCRTPIAWYDNVPVLSWLLLRARCRSCKAPIPIRYPLVELAGGAPAWLAVPRHGGVAAQPRAVLFLGHRPDRAAEVAALDDREQHCAGHQRAGEGHQLR